MVHNRDHNNDGHGVEVIEQIIGHIMGSHSSGQGVSGGTDTSVVELDDGLELPQSDHIPCIFLLIAIPEKLVRKEVGKIACTMLAAHLRPSIFVTNPRGKVQQRTTIWISARLAARSPAEDIDEAGMRTTGLRDELPRSPGAAEKTRPARPARVKLPMQILLTSPAKMPTPRRIDTSGASGAREFRSGAGASRRYPSCHHRGRDISLCQIQAALAVARAGFFVHKLLLLSHMRIPFPIVRLANV